MTMENQPFQGVSPIWIDFRLPSYVSLGVSSLFLAIFHTLPNDSKCLAFQRALGSEPWLLLGGFPFGNPDGLSRCFPVIWCSARKVFFWRWNPPSQELEDPPKDLLGTICLLKKWMTYGPPKWPIRSVWWSELTTSNWMRPEDSESIGRLAAFCQDDGSRVTCLEVNIFNQLDVNSIWETTWNDKSVWHSVAQPTNMCFRSLHHSSDFFLNAKDDANITYTPENWHDNRWQ